MAPYERLIEYLTHFSFNLHWLIKGVLLLGMFFYLAFGIIVIRQVSLMAKTLDGAFVPPLKTLAWIHLGMIVGLFFLILLIF